MSNVSVLDPKMRTYDIDRSAKKQLDEDHLNIILGLTVDNDTLKKEKEFLQDKLKKLTSYIHHETWCKVNSVSSNGHSYLPMGSCNCKLDSLLKSEVKK